MYDKYGNYGVMWWTNRSVEQYKARSDCMVHQYSKFSYFNKHVSIVELYNKPTECKLQDTLTHGQTDVYGLIV